jgi:hypothetical protein
MDLIYAIVLIGFAAASWGLIALCDWVKGGGQ